MASEVINSQIQLWRQKCREGTMGIEEMRQAMDAIRKERIVANTKSAVSRAKKATTAPIDSDDLLSQLM
jgi:Arc/MetJ-type ribon-helix-helix transcriptional regulator